MIRFKECEKESCEIAGRLRMSAQENKAVVLRYLTEMVNGRNVGLAGELFAADYVSRPPHGPELRGART